MLACSLDGSSSLSPLPPLRETLRSPAKSSPAIAPSQPTTTAYTQNYSPSNVPVVLTPLLTTSLTGYPSSDAPASSPGDGSPSTFWGRLVPVPSGFEWATIPVLPSTNLLRDTIVYTTLDNHILTPFKLRQLIEVLPQTPLRTSWGDAYNGYRCLHAAIRHFTRSAACR
ncbi:hypothetical protein BOTBODRAFT_181993 [Botryobasidium botryosum FD-172 SS1]|uniref:Uncharacterized protein n=1 Tax=Botryobasidium botryosum (strain FD-172 SS1) TaxID=930990 RepID=A0A067M2B0_BOTB1|nr:hypothetical protein BOTBODRAFT_181993 [Botryobasidium botryosum FD-172 SS1]